MLGVRASDHTAIQLGLFWRSPQPTRLQTEPSNVLRSRWIVITDAFDPVVTSSWIARDERQASDDGEGSGEEDEDDGESDGPWCDWVWQWH